MPMTDPALVFIAEDDPDISQLLSDYLSRDMFEVETCANGAELDAALARRRPDVIVLDLMMPGEDGLSICRRVSAAGGPPIIILSAKGDDLDRIVGLEVGADDYLAKPFNPRELTARIRAVLRRTAPAEIAAAPAADPREVYRFGSWRLDIDARTLEDEHGGSVPLTNGEFGLLAAFVRHPRRVLSRDQLLDLTRGPDASPIDRAIDVQLSRLRRKLGDDPANPALIKTVRGDGYLFASAVVRERAR